MYEEFKNKHEYQAHLNNQMNQLIREQNQGPQVEIKHTAPQDQQLEHKVNPTLREEYEKLKQQKQRIKEEERSNLNKNMDIINHQEVKEVEMPEKNTYFQKDDFQDGLKKQHPHYSNLMNRELGVKSNHQQ